MVVSNEVLVLLVSSLPVVELRGAIPIGIAKGMSLNTVLIFALLGNILPIAPLFLFFRWVIGRLEKLKSIEKLFNWWFKNVEKKSRVIAAYGFWGLVLFVAVPLPGTGAWTGSAAAALFKFKAFQAFLAISLGVLLAALFVTVGSLGVVKLWCIFI